MWGIIAWPFGKVLWLCYELVHNYGWALLLFTVIIKLIMLPSSMKQQLSTARMAKLNPKLEQLKKKYGDNREKLNEATMELYNQENINPMGSCLPMVITFVLLFAVIEVVYAPLSYIGNVSKDKLTAAQNTVYDIYTVSSAIKNYSPIEVGDGSAVVVSSADESAEKITVNSLTTQGRDVYDVLLEIKAQEKSPLAKYEDDKLKELSEILIAHPKMDEYFTDTTKVSQRFVAGGASTRTQLLVISVAKDYPDIFDPEVTKLCNELDYTFLGIYLGDYPSWKSILVLIPILSLVSQLAVTVLSQYYTKKNNGGAANMNKSMNIMLYGMPLFSFWIAFSFPAGIGIYWIFSSVLALVQMVLLNLYYTPARVDKILAKQNKKARKKPSLYQMALEQQKAQLAGQKSAGDTYSEEAETEEVKLSRAQKKEAERNALNEARRRYAEKYGDNEPINKPDDEDGKK